MDTQSDTMPDTSNECNVSNVGRPMGGHGHDVITDTTEQEDANDLPFVEGVDNEG